MHKFIQNGYRSSKEECGDVRRLDRFGRKRPNAGHIDASKGACSPQIDFKKIWHALCMKKDVMKNKININAIAKLGASDQGSILMEYVMVQVLVACLLMLVMNELFYNWGTAQFGPAGMGVKYFYQRLFLGLCLMPVGHYNAIYTINITQYTHATYC